MKTINVVKIGLIALAMMIAPVSFAAKADKIDVIMVYDAKPDKAEKNRVKALGGKTVREFKNFNMRVISVSENALKHLDKGKGVRFVAVDSPVEAFSAAQSAGWTAVVSARSGETEDTSISHLSAGLGCGQLKVGSFQRSERMAKWNECLRIQDELGADAFVMLTDVAAVIDHWGQMNARAIRRISSRQIRGLSFAAGSMGPKVEAACEFVEQCGGFTGIGRLEDVQALLSGQAGTVITREETETQWWKSLQA